MVENIAYIFPGQGAQYVGMGRDLYERYLQAKQVFDRADEVLGFNLSKLCFDGPLDALTQTNNCQLAILVTSIAAFEALKTSVKCQVSPPVVGQAGVRYAAGLSLGEYSALVACGAIKFDDALVLVKKRSELMSQAAQKYPGKMVAVLGLDLETVKNLSKEAGNEIANLNCPGQVVVTGNVENVDKFSVLAQAKGAKRLIELGISGAFHSTLMEEASIKLGGILEKTAFRMPHPEVISNVTAKPFVSIEDMRAKLALQVKSSVLWEDSVRFMLAQGVKRFFEIGPGKTLKGILRKIEPSLEVANIEKAEDILN
ncbi:MAG: ACP S-malonyltransferase [Candidatus Omnitrophota bacterium]|nr:ACP S-malonyltransferase [Candidatus Omnitrophota bacterium]